MDLDAPACVTAFNQLGVLRPEADLNSITEMVRKNFASGRIRSKASKPKLALPSVSPSPSTKTKTRSSSMKTKSLPAASAAAAPAPAATLAGAAVAETAAIPAMPVGGADGKPVDMNAATAASRKSLPDFVLPAQLAFVARALAQMEGVGKALVSILCLYWSSLSNRSDYQQFLYLNRPRYSLCAFTYAASFLL